MAGMIVVMYALHDARPRGGPREPPIRAVPPRSAKRRFVVCSAQWRAENAAIQCEAASLATGRSPPPTPRDRGSASICARARTRVPALGGRGRVALTASHCKSEYNRRRRAVPYCVPARPRAVAAASRTGVTTSASSRRDVTASSRRDVTASSRRDVT